jgi:hypothetical protein
MAIFLLRAARTFSQGGFLIPLRLLSFHSKLGTTPQQRAWLLQIAATSAFQEIRKNNRRTDRIRPLYKGRDMRKTKPTTVGASRRGDDDCRCD